MERAGDPRMGCGHRKESESQAQPPGPPLKSYQRWSLSFLIYGVAPIPLAAAYGDSVSRLFVHAP